MSTRAEIDARKAAIAAVKNGHNTFAGAFNQGAQALTPLAADFQPLIVALNAAAVAHNNSIPLITGAESLWNAAVPSDTPPITAPPSLSARYTEAELASGVDSLGNSLIYNSASNPGGPLLKYFKMTRADITRDFQNVQPNQIVEETTLAAYGYDVPAVKITNWIPPGIDPTAPNGFLATTLISWKYPIVPKRKSAWLRYVIVPLKNISAVDAGGNPVFVEEGVKLPGLASMEFYGTGNPGKWFSHRSWHLRPWNANQAIAPLWTQYPGIYWMKTYEFGPDRQQAKFDTNGHLVEDQVNTVDVFVQVNDVGQVNGIRDMYINDVPVMPDPANKQVLWTSWPDTLIDQIDFLVFAGGQLSGTAEFNYLIGPAMLSSVRGGMLRTAAQQPKPDTLPTPANWPDWRKALIGQPLFQKYVIAGTGYAGTTVGNTTAGGYSETMPFSGVAVDSSPLTARIFTVGQSGHDLADANSVNMMDLMRTPIWEMLHASSPVHVALDPSTNPAGNEPDGQPIGAHCYNNVAYLRRYGQLVRFMSANGNPNGETAHGTRYFDIALRQWLPWDGTIRPYLGPSAGGNDYRAACVQDPVTEDVYLLSDRQESTYSAATKTYGPITHNPNFDWGYMQDLLDKKRNLLIKLIVNFGGVSGRHLLATKNLTTGAYGNQNFFVDTTALIPDFPSPWLPEGTCTTHDRDNDLYWYAYSSNAGNVRAFAIDSNDGVIKHVIEMGDADASPWAGRWHWMEALNGVLHMPGHGKPLEFVPTWNPA